MESLYLFIMHHADCERERERGLTWVIIIATNFVSHQVRGAKWWEPPIRTSGGREGEPLLMVSQGHGGCCSAHWLLQCLVGCMRQQRRLRHTLKPRMMKPTYATSRHSNERGRGWACDPVLRICFHHHLEAAASSIISVSERCVCVTWIKIFSLFSSILLPSIICRINFVKRKRLTTQIKVRILLLGFFFSPSLSAFYSQFRL